MKILTKCLIVLVIMLGLNTTNFSVAQASGSSSYGVAAFISSFPSGSRSTAISKMTEAGFGWAREEFGYSDSMDFAPYDAAYSKLNSAGIKVLGLLSYPGSDKSHDQWKNYVSSVVSHYPGISAWEIMNEADNYLSSSDYVVYLREAREIIKAKNSGAIIVSSGVGARVEVYAFWNGIASAGGWDLFDALGLHVFHDGRPEDDSYNNGSLNEEIQQVVSNINKNGGGKKIWVTELGYDSNAVGLTNQANWLGQSLEIVHGFSEVEKIFVFRLCDYQNGFGILTSSFGEKEAFNAVKNVINGQPVVTPPPPPSVEPVVPPVETPSPIQTETPVVATVIVPAIPKIPIDIEKSFIRLDGTSIVPDGKKTYRIVVGAKDTNGKIVTDRKPSITLDGGETNLTDFVLVGDEWFAYVSSSEAGERTAKITVDGQVLGTLKLVFTLPLIVKPKTPPVAENKPVLNYPMTQKSNQPFNRIWLWYIVGVALLALITFFVIRYKLFRLKE